MEKDFSLEAIVLAGGLGTRLRSIVNNLPKPMTPIGEKPFLEYILKYLKKMAYKQLFYLLGINGRVYKSILVMIMKGWNFFTALKTNLLEQEEASKKLCK